MKLQKLCLLTLGFCLAAVTYGLAQTVPVTPTASISGQIKLKDNPAPGVAITLISNNRNQTQDATTKVTTDADGRYKFSQVAAGDYRVVVLAPGYVVFASSDIVRSGQQVTVKDGEVVERIDFTLTRGGVITGKVRNKDNRPVINEPVTLLTVDDSGKQANFNAPDNAMLRTDDRGEYRVYGLPTGKYLIGAGRGDNRGGGPPMFAQMNRTYQRTFYPDTTDATAATPVSVEAGQEVTAIDIRMSSVDTYAASGRVVDADSGNPINAVLIAHRTQSRNQRGGGGGGPMNMGTTDGTTGKDGEFKIEGLPAGSYSVYVVQDETTAEFYSEPASFEISSADVTGLEVKLQRAGSVAGMVALDGNTSPDLLITMQVAAMVRGSNSNGSTTSSVAPNGSFRVTGLAPGRVNLSVMDMNNPGPFSGLSVLRVERNGEIVQSGFDLAKGEQVTGVRIVVAKGNSTIRGVVRADGGTLTPDIRLMVFARRTDGGSAGGFGGGGMPTQVDSAGKFQIDNLVAGTYTVSVQAMGGFGGGGANRGGGGAAAQQSVTLTSGGTQDVVLTLDATALQAIQNSQSNQNQPGARGGGNQQGNPFGGQGQGQGAGQGPRRRP